MNSILQFKHPDVRYDPKRLRLVTPRLYAAISRHPKIEMAVRTDTALGQRWA